MSIIVPGLALLLLASAVLLRPYWSRLFGPVLIWDLVRNARRGRLFVGRFLYIAFLSVLLGWSFLLESPAGTLRSRQMANFAESFVYAFLVIQFLAAVFLTPSFTAGAIAEEKETRTLEFLLATDLSSREIVLSKLASRLGGMLLLLLSGLPILSFVQFLGGVDPDVVLAGFAATVVTVLSLGSLGMWYSVHSPKARPAIDRTYRTALFYVIISSLLWPLVMLYPHVANFPSTEVWTSPFTLLDAVEWLGVGNGVFAFETVGKHLSSGGTLNTVLPRVVGSYAGFHLLVALACCAGAVARLRSVAQRESSLPRTLLFRIGQLLGRLAPVAPQPQHGENLAAAPAISSTSDRPPVGDDPVFWRELYFEAGFTPHWIGRVINRIFFVLSLSPIALVVVIHLVTGGDDLGVSMNVWLRVAGTVVACGMLLHVAQRAARGITSEREKQTLEPLLLTALSSKEILWGKWQGCFWSVRWVMVWLGVNWVIGTLLGGLFLLAIPLLIGVWTVYAAFAAGLGLYFSVHSRTSRQAGFRTTMTLLAISFGPWIFCGCCLGGNHYGSEVAPFVGLFLSAMPPALLGILHFRLAEALAAANDGHVISTVGLTGLGLVCFGIAVGRLWHHAKEDFHRQTTPAAEPPKLDPRS